MPSSDVPITTIEQWKAIGEDVSRRHELLHGVYVMTPAPPRIHQSVVANLGFPMYEAVRDHPSVHCFPLLVDVFLGPATVVEPDITVFRVDGPLPEEWEDFPLPELVVEVVSPLSARWDRGEKRHIYQAAGAPEYWIVDIEARLVERWTPADDRPEIIFDRLTWQPAPDAAELVIELDTVFQKRPVRVDPRVDPPPKKITPFPNQTSSRRKRNGVH